LTRPFDEPIYVTRPILPSLDDLRKRLEEVWEAQWLTNSGVQHERLERRIGEYLSVPHVSLFNNGTIGLLAAVQGLGLTGEVITTPFTFPATPHALNWCGVTPVFCDIDPVRMTLDPAQVEPLLTPKTTGILAVHVYGIPCDVAGIQAVADRFGLSVIYDAAHAFGATLDGVGIGNFGDASVFSFHATKLFHTAEGGALTCRDGALKTHIDHLKNFGILNQEEVDVAGINGKMSEVHAALGLTVLDLVEAEIALRKQIVARYRQRLATLLGLTLMPQVPGAVDSYQYFSVRIDEKVFGCSRDVVFDALKTKNVFTRKYFYPLCTQYACYAHLPSSRPDALPVASCVVAQVLCLPLYGTLSLDSVDRICDMIAAVRPRA
jgi:dTDP-4-amino-4,6-dideoxygalactose transaminase